MPSPAELIAKYTGRVAGQMGTSEAMSSDLVAKYTQGGEDKEVGREINPGEHWTNPLQEQHPDVPRFFIKNFASATPNTMGRALAENFEVRHRGGYNFSIRKPGEKKWKVVDPNTWSDMIPFWGGDWSDILGDIFTGIASVAGTLVTAPGIVSTPAGAAGGAALAESVKQGIGSLLGSGVTPEEAAKSVAFEGTAGAVGEVGGRFLSPLVTGGFKAARRGLLGNAAEINAANAAKLAEYEKALATAAPIERAAITKPEMEVPSHGLLGSLARKGEKAADELALAETRGMKELLDTPEDVLRQQAVDLGIETTKEATEKDVKKAIIGGLDDISKKEVRKAEKGVSNLTGKETLSNVEKQQLRNFKSYLANKGLDTESVQKLVTDINAGNIEAAQRLGINLDRPKAEIAQEVFRTQSPEKIAAVRGQVERTMEGIAPDQPLEVDYIAQQASKEGRGAAGAERTFKGTQRAPLDEEAYRTAVAEAEGLNISELQSLLRRSGWEGPIPSDRDKLIFNLYETKFGKSGVGSPESLTGPEFLQSMFNVESKRKGFSPMETIRKENIAEIRAGGAGGGPATLAQTGREALEPSRLRSAALAARPIVRGAGKATEALGSILEAPSRGVAAAAHKLAPRWVEHFVKTPERQVFTGTAGSFASGAGGALVAIGGAGIVGKGLKKLGHAIAADNSGQMLIRLASRAPRDIAQKLLKPLEAKAERGLLAYKAAVFTMFHQPEVRQWIEKQENRPES